MSKRAEELCAGVYTLHDEAVQLADQVFFMAEKLQETQIAIQEEPLCIEYDNGGGQKGIRENPNYRAYEKLLTTYTKALNQLLGILENAAPVANTSNIISKLQIIADKKVG